MATNPSSSVPGFNPTWHPSGAVAGPSSLDGRSYGTRGVSRPDYAAMASGKRKNRKASRKNRKDSRKNRKASRRSARRTNTRKASRKNRKSSRKH